MVVFRTVLMLTPYIYYGRLALGNGSFVVVMVVGHENQIAF
jgi:hypothetical protein